MSLPRFTYNLLFHLRDGEQELFEHTTLKEARQHFALFGKEDADLYESISLYETDWVEKRDRLLDTKYLSA